MRSRVRLTATFLAGAAFALITAVGGWLAWAAIVRTESWGTIPYQGRLEKNGQAQDGVFAMRFALYDNDGSGGVTPDNLLWSETYDTSAGGNDVVVSSGAFSVRLGAVTSLDTRPGGSNPAAPANRPSTVDQASDLYLGIEVKGPGDAGFVPLQARQRLGSAAYALSAKRGVPGQDFIVDGKVGIGTPTPAAALDVTGEIAQYGVPATVPPGAVMFFSRATCPPGWLAADGATVPAGATYDRLRAATGASTPDLRGEFVRGLDSGRAVDSGRTLGSPQSDELRSHSHTLRFANLASYNTSQDLTTVGSGYPSYAGDAAKSGIINATGGAETRPRNVALLPCIKY